jgi:hypothetical protein
MYQLNWRIMTSEDAAVKFGTIQVPYASILVVSRDHSSTGPIHCGGLEIPKMEMQWVPKLKKGREPRTQTKKQDGAEFFSSSRRWSCRH